MSTTTTESGEPKGITRRFLVTKAGKAIAGAAIIESLDFGAGAIKYLTMRDEPIAHVWHRPDSRGVLVVAPGTRNNGLLMGEIAARHVRSSVISIEYAETNVDADKIVSVLEPALDSVRKPGLRVGHYWNSLGARIMAPVAHRIGEEVDLLMLDSCPFDSNDLRGINRLGAEAPKWLGLSRILDGLMTAGSAHSIPDATKDKAPEVDADLAVAHRNATVHADLLTMAAEMDALRGNIADGALSGFALRSIFLTTRGEDPLVVTETAVPKFQQVLGNLELHQDEQRPWHSHGVGIIYPGTVADLTDQHLES